VLIGDGIGGFSAQSPFRLGFAATSIASADLNGDGKVDFALASETSNNVSLLLNGSVSPAILDPSGFSGVSGRDTGRAVDTTQLINGSPLDDVFAAPNGTAHIDGGPGTDTSSSTSGSPTRISRSSAIT